MKKFVIKVASLSFIGVIFLFSLILLIVSIFVPQNIAKLCEDVGFNNTALYYAKKGYLKQQDIASCDYLLKVAIKCNDNAVLCENGEKFLLDEGVYDYISSAGQTVDYYDFIASKYIIAEYDNFLGKNSEYVYKAMSFSKDYRPGSAINAVIAKCFETNNREMLIVINSVLSDFYNSSCPDSSKQNCLNTMQTIDKFLNK